MGKGNTKKDDLRAIIAAAVTQAVEACMQGIDQKIEAAVNLGVTVGAAAGAEAGAAAAMKAAERVRKNFRKQDYDWKYHNTKLLLRNYRRLNEFFENAVFDTDSAAQADESFEDIMRSIGGSIADESIFVTSIQRNFISTQIIMTHVNKMLDCYRIMCERSNRREDVRRWRVLDGLYIANDYTTAAEIAKRENIDKRTIYKDIDICAADLTALFFGVGGIEEML